MKITRKSITHPTTKRPSGWEITTVTLEDGRSIRFYGGRMTDEEAMNRTADELESPAL